MLKLNNLKKFIFYHIFSDLVEIQYQDYIKKKNISLFHNYYILDVKINTVF